MNPSRNAEPVDPRARFSLYRLCECPECGGRAQRRLTSGKTLRCAECRGEGRIRQELATCENPEAVGVALVTLAREGEFEECPVGLLDRTPECEWCDGGRLTFEGGCRECKGSGVKPTGTWLIRPWMPSARNVTDAARTLARSKKTS